MSLKLNLIELNLINMLHYCLTNLKKKIRNIILGIN